MIRAVIFDYGNVISLPQTGEWYTVMEKKTGVPAAVFASSFEKYRVPFDRGEISGADMYAGILRDNGYGTLAADRALCQEIADTDLESWHKCDDNVTEWGLTLKKNGHRLGILSNMPYEFLDKYESSIRLFSEADAPVFSCREKLVKPEKAIYSRTLDRLGVSPGEAVFFDDIPENVEAAVRLGIHGFVWTGLEQAKNNFGCTIRKENAKISPDSFPARRTAGVFTGREVYSLSFLSVYITSYNVYSVYLNTFSIRMAAVAIEDSRVLKIVSGTGQAGRPARLSRGQYH